MEFQIKKTLAKDIYWDDNEGMHTAQQPFDDEDGPLWLKGDPFVISIVKPDPEGDYDATQFIYFGVASDPGSKSSQGLCGPNECFYRIFELEAEGAFE